MTFQFKIWEQACIRGLARHTHLSRKSQAWFVLSTGKTELRGSTCNCRRFPNVSVSVQGLPQ